MAYENKLDKDSQKYHYLSITIFKNVEIRDHLFFSLESK